MKTNINRSIEGTLVTVTCKANLSWLAEKFLDTVEVAVATGLKLRHGSKIKFGWSLVILEGAEHHLVAHEPDYDGSPLTAIRPDLTLSLSVVASQLALLERLKLPVTESPQFIDTIIVAKGALDSFDVYLHHQAPASAGDSGWYIGFASGPQPTELYKLPIYCLAKSHVHLLNCLVLPRDFIAVLEGTHLAAVLDSMDRDLLAHSPVPAPAP